MRLVALDMVRFSSAIAVLAYHFAFIHTSNPEDLPPLAEFFKFGYLGVPLFFMISGFVITLSAQNRSAYEFAVCRFTRLYPTFWTAVAVTVLVVSLLGENHYSLPQVLTNLTMLNNYLGYENIDGIYWTLHAELKFYACVFLLLLFGVFPRIRIWLSLWLAIAVLYFFTSQPFFMGWFITPVYSSYFIAGIAFFLIHQQGINRYNLIILLVSFLLSSAYGFLEVRNFLQVYSLGTQIGAMLLVWSFFALFYFLVTGRINLRNRRLYLILGGLTYPLYLIHNSIGKTLIGSLPLAHGLAVAVCIAVLIAMSALMDAVVDKRFSRHLKHFLLQLDLKPGWTWR